LRVVALIIICIILTRLILLPPSLAVAVLLVLPFSPFRIVSMSSNGTTTLLPHPSPLPDLPPVEKDLKSQIYTHSSNVSQRDPVSYNRLAMLGDAHLHAAITYILFNHDPSLEPGEMTTLRNMYVSNKNVANWGRAYTFDQEVNVARHVILSEENIDRMAAGSFEAYLGAIVLSSSQQKLTNFIAELVRPGLKSARKQNALKGRVNGCSDRHALQKLHQKLTAEGKALPDYTYEEVGEKTGKSFVVKCILGEREVSRGEAKSVIDGKRLAAEQVLRKPAKFFAALPDAKKPNAKA
jgi:dsRNA-specific ribonuclease